MNLMSLITEKYVNPQQTFIQAIQIAINNDLYFIMPKYTKKNWISYTPEVYTKIIGQNSPYIINVSIVDTKTKNVILDLDYKIILQDDYIRSIKLFKKTELPLKSEFINNLPHKDRQHFQSVFNVNNMQKSLTQLVTNPKYINKINNNINPQIKFKEQ